MPEEELIPWKESFEVYIPELDSQHKRLLMIINDLYNYMKSNTQPDELYIESLLNELIKFALYHFSTEERYMIRYRYPDYDTHKKEHELLTNKVKEYYVKYKQSEVDLDEILNFLVEWFTQHATGVDSKYVSYFQSLDITS